VATQKVTIADIVHGRTNMNVRDEFTYNSRTGEICFSLDGKSAVSMDKGRHVIKLNGESLSAAVVAWKIYHGEVISGQTVVMKNELGGLNIHNLKLVDESSQGLFDPSWPSMQSPADTTTPPADVVVEEEDELFSSMSGDEATGEVEFVVELSTEDEVTVDLAVEVVLDSLDPVDNDDSVAEESPAPKYNVEFDSVSGKWRALLLQNNGKLKSLGLFKKESSAQNVAKRSQVEYNRAHEANDFTS
jgi:hypothetical protein